MSSNFILLIILFILLVAIGGKRGFKTFISTFINFILLFMMIILISKKYNSIKVTVIFSIVIVAFTLFFVNGINKKTLSALLSVSFAMIITLLITYSIGINAKLQGFSQEETEAFSHLSTDIQLDFIKIFTVQVFIGLLGALIDVSIGISSSMNEIHKNNPKIHTRALITSGMNIGKDVIGTMTNTLLFAFIGGFLSLAIYLSKFEYSFSTLINNKIICSEIFQILCSGIGIVLIVPITTYITSKILNLSFRKPKNIVKKT
ncbi:MAG: YibE/F family protein [Clostridiales bacterium]